MRNQTSLEFLIIAGAIGLLVLSSVTQYGGMVKNYKAMALRLPTNYSIAYNPTYYQKPYFEAQISPTSSQGSNNLLSMAAYGCANGTVSVQIKSQTMSLSAYNITQDFYNVWVYQDKFTPSSNPAYVSISYAIACAAVRYNGSINLSSTSAQQPASSQYYAYLSGRNESISYIPNVENIPYLSQPAHCTYENFFYTPYPIGAQCGTSNAWQYRVFSSPCSSNGGSMTETYCVVPQQSAYNLTSTSATLNYTYSVNLTMDTGYVLRSYLSSRNATSRVYFAGQPAGNASINAINYSSAGPLTMLSYGNTLADVNYSLASGYDQARQNLFSMLSFYNSSTVSPEIALQISQGIYEYNYYAGKLINASESASQSQCSKENGIIKCPAQSPFYYGIDAKLAMPYAQSNQTTEYQGSIIRVYD